MDKGELRARITERIASGALPRENCLVTWYGPGRGNRCVACDERILGTDIEVACDLPGEGTIYFHSPCYDLWHAALA